MDTPRWEQIEALFFAALERDNAARGAFLDEACAGNVDLRREIDAMLSAHEDSRALAIEDRLLGADAGALGSSDPEALLDTRIGSYRLVRVIGQGGMSEVFLAERDDQHYRQQVALKLVRTGHRTTEIVARFRVERQILARLVHPNIVPLLDGGVTDDGRPYLVMPYIEGVSITQYCDTHRLPVDERLRLFRTVCAPVQFAHRNLVVHRDLKPSNILVTEAGEVKLLDFGIAKLLDPQAVDLSVALTRSEVRIMTPEYAAPEQVTGQAVTTATDGYALGILLYELLTGHRPYQLSGRRQAEIDRIICEEEPTRPSLVVSKSAKVRRQDGTAPTVTPERVGRARSTQAGRLRRKLQGDLDNIVLMALRKAPERRYASAEALSGDVHRYLERRPVHARPDTAWYRTKKFVRRNRIGVGVAATAFLLVLGFGVLMAVQASRITRQAQELTRERDRVQREAGKTAQVKSLVSDLFKVLDPNVGPGGAGSPLERLEAGSKRIIQDLKDQPELQAELMDEVITIYINLGLYEAALPMAEASLALRRATFAPSHQAIAWGMHRWGEVLFLNGRFEAAETRYREALALRRVPPGGDHVELALTLVRLARLHRIQGRLEEAEACATEALDIYRTAYGDAHPDVAEALYWLAAVRRARGASETAEAMFGEALALRRTLLGEDHPEVAWTLVSLAHIKIERGQLDRAEAMIREALAIHETRYGDEHPDLTRTRNALGRLYEARGEFDRAEAIYRSNLAARRKKLGVQHPTTGTSLEILGSVRQKQGDFEEAEALFQEALAIRRMVGGPGRQPVVRPLKFLMALYEEWNRPDKYAEYRFLLSEVRLDPRQEADAAPFVVDQRQDP